MDDTSRKTEWEHGIACRKVDPNDPLESLGRGGAPKRAIPATGKGFDPEGYWARTENIGRGSSPSNMTDRKQSIEING